MGNNNDFVCGILNEGTPILQAYMLIVNFIKTVHYFWNRSINFSDEGFTLNLAVCLSAL